ncbi:hypothetical protein MRX96_055084 [Rhipicephalus microplus]
MSVCFSKNGRTEVNQLPCVGNYGPCLAHALYFSVRPIPSVAELRDVSVVGDASFASRRPRSSAQLTPVKLRSDTDEAPPRSSCSGRRSRGHAVDATDFLNDQAGLTLRKPWLLRYTR